MLQFKCCLGICRVHTLNLNADREYTYIRLLKYNNTNEKEVLLKISYNAINVYKFESYKCKQIKFMSSFTRLYHK